MEFQWNDIQHLQQLDKMLNISGNNIDHQSLQNHLRQFSNIKDDTATHNDGENIENNENNENSENNEDINVISNSSSNTPVNTIEEGTKADTLEHNNIINNRNITKSPADHTPANSNNDYMLFLNLTTPGSTVSEQEIHNHNKPEKSQDSENTNKSAIFSFDGIDTANLEFIMDQKSSSNINTSNYTQQQRHPSNSQYHSQHQHQNQHHFSFSNGSSVPPVTQSRSRLNSEEFTPLLSPMINPSLERVNSNKGKPGFSPLSSPVLEFQKYNNATTLRQKRKDPSSSNNDIYQNPSNNNTSSTSIDQSSSTISSNSRSNNNNNSIKFDNSDSRSYKRSKTPVTTPLMSTLDRKAKVKTSTNSASSSTQTTPYQTFVFKQQQFPNISNSTTNTSTTSNSKENSLSTTKSSINISNGNIDFSSQSFLDAFDGDLTLPPPPTGTDSSKNSISMSNSSNGEFLIPNANFLSNMMINNNNNNSDNLTDSVATPATLMSLNSTPNMFTSTATSSVSNSTKKNSVLLNPNHHKSSQSSPVILPSSSIPVGSPRLDSKSNSSYSMTPTFRPSLGASNFTASNLNNNNNNNNNVPVSAVGTNILGTPQLSAIPNTPNDNNLNLKHHGGSDKKISHKLAEQGRRNRMNIAIQELDKLIPESMKRNITVPSKATTVELGCRYIQELLDQVHNNNIKNQNSGSCDATVNGNNNGNTINKLRNESISPMDDLEGNNQ